MKRRWMMLCGWLVCAACTERTGGVEPMVSASQKEITMSLSDEFKTLADEWQQHCQRVSFSSKMSTYLDHPSYRKIVSLGEPAIPLIMDRYRQDDLPWGFALQEITGVKMIENPSSFKPKEVKQKWLDWWDQKRKSTGEAGAP